MPRLIAFLPHRAHRRAAFLSALVLACSGLHAAAPSPVTLAPEVSSALVRLLQTPRQPELDRLRAKLDALEQEFEASDAGSEDASAVHAHLLELRSLRLAVTQAVQRWHEVAGSTRADAALTALHSRFDALEQALTRVQSAQSAHDARQVQAARSALHRLLLGMRPPEAALPTQLAEPVSTVAEPAPASSPAGGRAGDVEPPAYAQATLRRASVEPPRTRKATAVGATFPITPVTPNTLTPTLSDETATAAPPLDSATGTDCAATAADLADDGAEIQLTTEIKALAKSLNYSPVQMLAWVQKNITLQTYWGSAKGAAVTLQARAGNATDQSSLLIALLRASNVPARFVRGVVVMADPVPTDTPDGRAQRWLGTKNYAGSLGVLNKLANVWGPLLTSSNGGATFGVSFEHVWVQACLPYAAYRGTRSEGLGYRWQPLEPTIKGHDYQAGLTVNAGLDESYFSSLLASRNTDPPNDMLTAKVEAAARQQRADASAEDVPYAGRPRVPRMDVLPSSPPFLVDHFTAWPGSGSAETAVIPAAHRWQFRVAAYKIDNSLLFDQSLSLPAKVASKVTLSYLPDAASQAAWNAWNGSLLTPAGGISVMPRLLVDGIEQVRGATLGLGALHQVVLELRQGERTSTACASDPSSVTTPAPAATSCVNKAVYPNLTAGGYYALGLDAGQASAPQLAQRAALLADGVRNNASAPTPAAGGAYDATVGELLHFVLGSYAHQAELSSQRLAALLGYKWTGTGHLGLTGSDLQTTYAFDIPLAVKPGGPYVDYKGGVSGAVKIDSTVANAPGSGQAPDQFAAAFNAAQRSESFVALRQNSYARSALEHQVWQQALRTDAVSTVRGLQFAYETGIPVKTLVPGNTAATALPLLDGPTQSAIQTALNTGATVTTVDRAINYSNADNTRAWKGGVYFTENANTAQFGSIISGGFAGGYPLINSTAVSNLYAANASAPSTVDASDGGLGRLVTLVTGQAGNNANATLGGDPVNMVTGQFVFNQTDLRVKARGGLDAVFERWYNSGDNSDSGLGRGWTHSFNHRLNLYPVEGGLAKVGWVNGSGGEAFFSTSSITSGQATPGTTLTPGVGVWSTLSRNADGTYRLREQNGMSYVFEPAVNSISFARLRSITDRNGNVLSITYATFYSCGPPSCVASIDPGKDASSTPNTGITDPHPVPSDYFGQVSDATGRVLLTAGWGGTASQPRMTMLTDGTRTVRFAYTDAARNLTQVTDARSKPHTFSYYSSADGPKRDKRLKTLIHPKGNGLLLEYYSNGQVFRHTALDFAGQQLRDADVIASTTFEYNLFTREASTTNERGYRRTYHFDASGNPLRITDETGSSTTYTYDNANPFNRLSETDSLGHTTSYSYASANLVDTVTLPNGATLAFKDYNAFAQPQRSKDARGNWRWMRYDTNGNLTDSIALTAGSVPTAGTLPSAGNIKAWTRQSYDAYGNPTTTTRVSNFAAGTGPSLTLNYDTGSLNVQSLTRVGNRNGTAVNETTPAFTYDAQNRLKTGVDARWYAITQSFDEQDRPLTQTDALGNLHTLQYDDNGNFKQRDMMTTNADGSPNRADGTVLVYDERDRLTSQTDAAGNPTSYAYDAVGNLTQATSPDGYSRYFTYDAANRRVASFDEAGNRTLLSLDTQGRVLASTDPNGNTTSQTYWSATSGADRINLGRLRRVIEPAIGGRAARQLELAYDAAGHPVQRTRYADDGVSTRQSFSSYDELGRLVRSVGEPDSLNANQRLQTCLKFSPLGDLIEVWAGPTTANAAPNTDGTCDFGAPGLKRQLSQSFDDFGQLLTRTDALGKVWSYGYDFNGNLVSSQSPEQAKLASTGGPRLLGGTDSPGNFTQTLYDLDKNGNVRGLPSSNTAPDSLGSNHSGPASSYRYNALGQPVHVETYEASTSLGLTYDTRYDAAHRVKSVTDSRGRTLAYDWTPGGRLASLEIRLTPDGAATHRWDYKYDNLGRLSLVVAPSGQSVNLLYDAAGRLIERDVNRRVTDGPSLLRSSYTYQADNRLVDLSHRTSSAGSDAELLGHGYAFDAWGNRKQHTRRANTRDQSGTETLSYGYDSLDRLTSTTVSGAWSGPSNSGNSAAPSETYGYDLFGNRTARTSNNGVSTLAWSYAHDDAQRLTAWSQSSGGSPLSSALLRYDDNGNLRVLCDSGGSSGNVSDASTASMADCTASGSAATRAQYGWTGQGLLGRYTLSDASGHALLSEVYAYDAAARRVGRASTRNSGPEFTPQTLATLYLYTGQDIAADWQSVGPDVSAGNPLPSFNSRAYVYAGLDQPVLRGYFDGTDGSTSPDGGYQVYAPDGLGSVMGVLGQQRSIDLVQQSENTLSSQGGFNAGSYANPKAWGAPADGSVRDPSYFSGDTTVNPTPSVTLTLAQPTRVNYVNVGPDNSLTPTGYRLWVQGASGSWQLVASAGSEQIGGVKLSFPTVLARAVRLELLGGANPLAPNRMIINSWRVFSASSEGDDYAASTQSFDGWGNVTQGLQGVPSFGFTGREPDSSGLTYYRARYYHPGIGRFISRDPIGLAGGINGYAYVENNPVNFVDPMGMQVSVSQDPRNASSFNVAFANVFFTGPGATQENIRRFIDATQTRLSGTFLPAGINVNTSISTVQSPVAGGITVKFTSDDTLLASGWRGYARRNPVNLNQSLLLVFPKNASDDTIVHEDIHGICPTCVFTGVHGVVGNDIMNSSNGPRTVSSATLLEAFRGAGAFRGKGSNQDSPDAPPRSGQNEFSSNAAQPATNENTASGGYKK